MGIGEYPSVVFTNFIHPRASKRMSWFDSSFSFAKTALSQAQKSIDKVLDIKEENASGLQATSDPASSSVSSEVVSTTASVSRPSSTSTDSTAPLKTHGAPEPPSKSSPFSTWFSPSHSERGKQPDKAQNDGSTPTAEKHSSVLGSTWGAGDSFWGSYFSTPGASDQGGGEGGVKGRGQAAPTPTSMVRDAANRKVKSPSSAKPENRDRRKKATSLGLNSPPQSSSTPLPQSREKTTKVKTPSSTPSSSKQPSRQGRLKTSEGTSQQRPEQPLAKESRGREESGGKEESGGREESDGPKTQEVRSDRNVQEAASGDMEVPGGSVLEDNMVEIANDGSKAEVNSGTVAKNRETSPRSVQNELAESKGECALDDIVPKASKGVEVTSKSPTSPLPQPLTPPPPHGDVGRHTSEVDKHVPTQPENTGIHSPPHHDSQEINTEPRHTEGVQQTAVVQQITVASKETKTNSQLTEQQAQNTDPSELTLNREDENLGENKRDINTKNTTEIVSRKEKERQSSLTVDKGGGERQETVSECKEDSHSSKEMEIGKEHSDIDRLRKELAEVRQVLEARELKMVDMSREAISLAETNQSLQEQLDEARRTGQTDVEDLRSEFTRRLATTEKKLQAVVKERDSLRKQLQALQDEQTQQKRSTGDEVSRLIKEKDEQITQLMEEGEKLSKQELQSNGVIKKLRQKDKQNDQLMAAQRQQIEDLEGKVKILKEQLKKKEENEAKYQESLAQLNTIAEQQAKELTSLKSERDGLLDKVRSLQTNLDNSYKELAELQKANAVTQSAAQEAAQSAEQSAKEKLMSILEQQKVGAQREKEALHMQVDELRVSVSRTEQQAAWREDHLRQELADMQQRLQEAETRNQELTSSISQATKPLLRQIENLQAAHSAQSANWDKIEASLTQRLVQTQAQLSQSSEKERSAVEKELTSQSRVRNLETQLSSTKQEKSQLLASLELERAKLQTLEENQHRESAKTEALRTSYQQSTEELRKEKEMLERQLEYERVRLEAESRKACLESQEKERLRAQLASSLSLSRTVSRQSSSGSQSEILEKSLHAASDAASLSDVSPLTSRGTAPSASLIEQLQSLLKQREGELSNAQNLVSSLERSRAAMAEDLANISAQHETLMKEVETIPHLKHKLQEVERKHEAMLQMYGEKAEEAEELKLDIEDLKSMYRQQIEELLNRRR